MALLLLVVSWALLQGTLSVSAPFTIKTWCYTENSQKTISCQDKNSVLAVVRAFSGIKLRQDSQFCQFPESAGTDCVLSEVAKTDEYRQQCNVFNTCSLSLHNPPQNSCGEKYEGDMYLTIEYTCHTVSSVPVIGNCPTGSTVSAPSVMLYNDHYPRGTSELVTCTLHVTSQTGSPVDVTFCDVAHDVTDNLACPYYVRYGLNAQRRCARRGATYTRDQVRSGSYLQVVVNATHAAGRYWMQISAEDRSNVTLQGIPEQTIAPTTTPTTTISTTTTSTTSVNINNRPTTTTTTTTITTAKPTPTTPTTASNTPTTQITKTTTTVPGSHVTGSHVTGSHVPGSPVTYMGHVPPEGDTTELTTLASEEESMGDATKMAMTTTLPTEMTDGLKIIIGGAVAGAVIVFIVVACVAVCVGRRKKKPVKRRADLGYMVHANMAIATKLGATPASRRHPASSPRPHPQPASGAAEYVNTGSPLPPPTGGGHLRSAALRRSARPSYQNVDMRKSRGRHNRKSASQTTLTAQGSSESLDAAQYAMPGSGDPYAVSGIFAGFPRWADNPRSSGAEDQYDILTSTLPAQLNKKPMPLPKPQHRPSYSQRPPTSSSLSLDQPDFGTARSTDALYAVPNKVRRPKDVIIVENELFIDYGE